MIEIKFRAWDKITKKFIPIQSISFDTKKIQNIVLDDDGFILRSEEEVDLMQFTNLFDRNGKEIYEGDILSNKLILPQQVFYDHGCFYFDMNLLHSVLSMAKLQIVGNIYENPELMEK